MLEKIDQITLLIVGICIGMILSKLLPLLTLWMWRSGIL